MRKPREQTTLTEQEEKLFAPISLQSQVFDCFLTQDTKDYHRSILFLDKHDLDHLELELDEVPPENV